MYLTKQSLFTILPLIISNMKENVDVVERRGEITNRLDSQKRLLELNFENQTQRRRRVSEHPRRETG